MIHNTKKFLETALMLNTERYFISILISIMLMLLAGKASARTDEYNRALIKDRIAPVGQVKIAGQEGSTTASNKAPETTVSAEKATTPSPAANSGEATYKSYCITCHATGLAGAPKFGDKTDWQKREKNEKGIDGLLTKAIKGFNAMPPRGTCATCTDEQLKQAIEYMLPKK